ncbi:MAG TPA: hypothetical protein VHI95_10270 [Acidimicrobiales bacterium]|jgi:hypothetical protein|nr:hypothetical protein [Acidimicrobiales bacterium]
MARKEGKGEHLAMKERVVATTDLPGIPEGTTGKVIVVEGLTWIRYWVRFANGVVRGSLNRKVLARPSEWAELVRRREAGEDVTAGDDGTAAAEVDGAGAADSGGAGDSVMVNGVPVPAHLLERSKNRRQVLGV